MWKNQQRVLLSENHRDCLAPPCNSPPPDQVEGEGEEEVDVVLRTLSLGSSPHYPTVITPPRPELTLMFAHWTEARPTAVEGGQLTLSYKYT